MSPSRQGEPSSGGASSTGMLAMGTDSQTRPEQTPLGQALPQAPQCAGSEERSRQRSAAPQYSNPTEQSARTHSPPRHSVATSPLSQTMPHTPQLPGSLLRSTQPLLQRVKPGSHEPRQDPLLHDRPSPQTLPQEPQFAGSEPRSMQTPVQE